MKALRYLSLLIVFATAPFAALAGRAVADIPNVHVADRTRYVSNPDDVLSDSTVAALDRTLAQVWRQTSAEPVVVVVASMPSDTDIDTYATAIFDDWKIGKSDRDNGVLMVVARDDRKAVIRTGYGAEGVLPDVICGRILRNEMFPRFKQGDYDGGVTAGVNAIGRVLTDPEYAAELRSQQANDAGAGAPDFDTDEIWAFYTNMCLLAGLAMLVWAVASVWNTRRLDSVTRYEKLHAMLLPATIITVVCLGTGAIALIVLIIALRRTRSHRKCPNCGHAMRKIDEEHDNDYLTPAQDAEERLKSVDYDVWVCPQCRETDVLPYVNPASRYGVCQRCGARATQMVMDRVTLAPTERRKGMGQRTFHCQACGHNQIVAYTIPMVVAPIIIGGIGGNGGGGGGFGGGSFGGGMTGGGGASGGW